MEKNLITWTRTVVAKGLTRYNGVDALGNKWLITNYENTSGFRWSLYFPADVAAGRTWPDAFAPTLHEMKYRAEQDAEEYADAAASAAADASQAAALAVAVVQQDVAFAEMEAVRVARDEAVSKSVAHVAAAAQEAANVAAVAKYDAAKSAARAAHVAAAAASQEFAPKAFVPTDVTREERTAELSKQAAAAGAAVALGGAFGWPVDPRAFPSATNEPEDAATLVEQYEVEQYEVETLLVSDGHLCAWAHHLRTSGANGESMRYSSPVDALYEAEETIAYLMERGGYTRQTVEIAMSLVTLSMSADEHKVAMQAAVLLADG